MSTPSRTAWTGGLLSRRESLVTVWAVVIGVLLALVLSLLTGGRFTGTALADGGPGGSVEAALDVSPDIANRYVQTELVYIDILKPQFDQAMQDAGLPATAVTANQEGTTNVIALATDGADTDQAARAANVALDVYIANWKERTTADLQRLLDNTNQRIEQVRSQLDQLGTGEADAAARRGLLTELTRLTTEASDLEFRIGGVKAANRVVERATPENATRTTSRIQLILLGFIAGLAVALVYIVFTRARRLSQPRQE